MRARRLAFLVVLFAAAAALSGCLPKDTIKIENELSKLTDRFIEQLEAEELPELEAFFADLLLLHPSRHILQDLALNMGLTKEYFLTYWLPDPPAPNPDDPGDLWTAGLLQEMLTRYKENPTDPTIGELAGAASARLVLGHYFSELTEAAPQVVAGWLDAASFSEDGLTVPSAVVAQWLTTDLVDRGIPYDVAGRSSPFEVDGKWFVLLDMVGAQPWYTADYELILGFSKMGEKWLIDYFRVVYN